MAEKYTEHRSNVILLPTLFAAARGDRDMQVNCTECGTKAVIYSRKVLDTKVSQLYCSCKSPACGHTFVMDLAFSHTLSPSVNQLQNVVVNLLRALPEAERKNIMAAV